MASEDKLTSTVASTETSLVVDDDDDDDDDIDLFKMRPLRCNMRFSMILAGRLKLVECRFCLFDSKRSSFDALCVKYFEQMKF